MSARDIGLLLSVAWLVGNPAYGTALVLSDGTVPAGETVRVSVSLNAQGDDQIANTRNDIHFDAPFHILPGKNGRPDCWQVERATNIGYFSASFMPMGCMPGVDCTGIRAQFLDNEDTDTIADGAVIYRCNVTIDANAAPGAHALRCDGTLMGGANGMKVDNAGCRNSTITVLPCRGDCDLRRSII